MGLEASQFEPTKKQIAGREQSDSEGKHLSDWSLPKPSDGKIERCTCKNCRAESREIDCLCCREVDAISDEQFSGNIFDVLHIRIKCLYFSDRIVVT